MATTHPEVGRHQGELDKRTVLRPGHTLGSVTGQLSDMVLKRPYEWRWLLGFSIGFALLNVFMMSAAYLLFRGTGIWGLRSPVMWGFAIVNFVWWVGIGHAGTLISAILLLFRQEWRTSINRFAEAMTLFAVACAGMFPLLHMGRPWIFYWLMPYPNSMALWPQWRSPLVWDVFAVSTYATISLLFWYVGLVPDLATLRDRATKPIARMIYGAASLGWRGSSRHWHRYRTSYMVLAALATPLVVSVHTVVSFDFTIGIVPGWHSTIFPPYFVAGAIFSGFAMVLTLAIPLRSVYGLKDYITPNHLDNMAKILLATGMIVSYGYGIEAFIAWYGNNPYEYHEILVDRPFGDYRHYWYALMACNCITPQLLWIPRIRTSIPALFVISLIINVGMWLERFIIVVSSLHNDFVPASWDRYDATIWDWALYLGTFGLFFTLMFLFIRVLPAISIVEMRELVHHKEGHHQVAREEPIAGPSA